mmetsp:Transcript_16145/g.25026  ORF Transcript_16145/g.25026 Transcript_16145/m.25026 type:complete len:95 (-) Transcript_16145:481-765(-)
MLEVFPKLPLLVDDASFGSNVAADFSTNDLVKLAADAQLPEELSPLEELIGAVGGVLTHFRVGYALFDGLDTGGDLLEVAEALAAMAISAGESD